MATTEQILARAMRAYNDALDDFGEHKLAVERQQERIKRVEQQLRDAHEELKLRVEDLDEARVEVKNCSIDLKHAELLHFGG